MREARLTQRMLFKLPIILKIQPDVEADGPIVIFPLDRIGERAALRMALDASVGRVHVIHARGILNIRARGIRHVLAAGPVATFAAHVPLGDAMIADIEVDGMAAVAERARGALHIIRRVERRPPVAIVGYEVGAPDVIHDVPLRRLRVIIVIDFSEVALFPKAAVNQSNVVPREFFYRVGGQIGKDGFGMLARITHDICHGRFLPPRVDLGVAGLAGPRADVTRRELRLSLWLLYLCRRLLTAQRQRIDCR